MENTWYIYSSDGEVIRAAIHKLDYNGTYMGERYLSVTVESPHPIAWSVGDYIDYRGERFTLQYIPAKKRQARSGSRGDAIVYDSIRFQGVECELEQTQFVDLVPFDSNIPYTAMGAFTFYVGKVSDFACRIQANLDDKFGSGKWEVVCDDTLGVNKDKAMSISANTSVYNALAQFNNEFHANFIVTGDRKIFFGDAQKVTGHSFVYGKGHGLKSLTENYDDSQAIVTRAKCYGSTKNIPYMWYVNIDRQTKVSVTKVLSGKGFMEANIDLPYNELYFKTKVEKYDCFVVKLRIDGLEEITARIYRDYSSDETSPTCRVYSEPKNSDDDPTDEPDKTKLDAFISAVKEGTTIYITQGVDYGYMPSTRWWIPIGVPDNYSIHHLMLPGFPKESLSEWVERNQKQDNTLGNALKEIVKAGFTFSTDKYRPYIISPTATEYGLRDGEKIFDQDDDENEWWEIYPSMEEMTKTMLSDIVGYDVNSITADDDERVDKVLTTTTVEDNGTSASGNFSDGQTDINGKMIHTQFKLRIPNIGFNIWDYVTTGETPTISMKSGMCAGRSFEITNCIPLTPITEGYELTINRELDQSIERLYPYDIYPISKGDKYVLTGIELPSVYVTAAAVRLFLQSIDWILDNCKEKKTYQPDIDNIWMAEHPEESDSIVEGMKFMFSDDELGISERAVTIAQLTIKEGAGGENAVSIPQYEMQLDDDQEATLMQKVDARIKASYADYSRSFSSIDRALDNRLRKDRDDTSVGAITAKAFHVGSTGAGFDEEGRAYAEEFSTLGYSKQDRTGVSVYEDAQKKGHVRTNFLEVLDKFVAHTLEVRELQASAGNVLLNAAGFKIISVEEVTHEDGTRHYRCSFKQNDGEQSVANTFQVGDFAKCQTLNLNAGTSENASNRYYWRLVTEVGKDYVDLSEAECDPSVENDVPAVGDSIAQLGNGHDSERQNAIMLSVVGDEAPSIVLYSGINTYSLAGTSRTVIGKLDGIAQGDFPKKPEGYGIWSDNAYFRGEFYIASKQADITTLLEAMDGKISAQIASVRADMAESDSFLANPMFANNLEHWTTHNGASLFSVGGHYIWANNTLLGKVYGTAKVVTDSERNVLLLENNSVEQKNADMRAKPTFYTDEAGKIIPQSVYLSFYYKADTAISLSLGFSNTDASNTTEGYAGYSDTISLEATNGSYKTVSIGPFDWNGTGDFTLSVVGSAKLYALVLSNSSLDAFISKYSALFEMQDNLVRIAAAVENKDTGFWKEAGIDVDAERVKAEVRTELKKTGIDIQLGNVDVYGGRFNVKDADGEEVYTVLPNGTARYGKEDAEHVDIKPNTGEMLFFNGRVLTSEHSSVHHTSLEEILTANIEMSVGSLSDGVSRSLSEAGATTEALTSFTRSDASGTMKIKLDELSVSGLAETKTDYNTLVRDTAEAALVLEGYADAEGSQMVSSEVVARVGITNVGDVGAISTSHKLNDAELYASVRSGLYYRFALRTNVLDYYFTMPVVSLGTRSVSVKCKVTSANVANDGYVARYFGNGMCLSRNASEYFALLSDADGHMNVYAATNGHSIAFEDGMLKVDGARQPVVVFAGLFTDSTMTFVRVFSQIKDLPTPTVTWDGTANRYAVEMPNYGVSNDNSVVTTSGSTSTTFDRYGNKVYVNAAKGTDFYFEVKKYI